MRKGQSTLSTVITIIVLILIVWGGYYLWTRARTDDGINNGNNNGNPTAWKTYEWGTFVFQYPPDWTVREEKYRTPAQAAAGEPEQTVGLTVYKGSPTSTDAISIGGRQITCTTLSRTTYNCATFYDLPVYERKTSAALDVYNKLLTTIVHKEVNDDFQVENPDHLDTWRGGQTYAITWDTKTGVSSTKVDINIVSASTSLIAYSAKNIDNDGSYDFLVPNTKAASSTFHYIHITKSVKVTATTTKIYNGWSDPFYIEAPGPTPPAASTTTMIRVTQPLPNARITSPLAIRGEARGNWYFEADFPIKLLSATGSLLAETFATAQGDWMTTNFVPFTATLTFRKPTSATGTLVFEKANPSGLPQNAGEFRVPIRF